MKRTASGAAVVETVVVVSPFGAAAVAILGLLVGVWLAAGTDGHELPGAAAPAWSRPAGWALILLAVLLFLLAVPTSSETAPPPAPERGVNSGPAAR